MSVRAGKDAIIRFWTVSHALSARYGRIIISFRTRSRQLSTRCSVWLRFNARSEVVGKRPARRLALDSPFCFRWRVASSRWLPLALQLTMIRTFALSRQAFGIDRAPAQSGATVG